MGLVRENLPNLIGGVSQQAFTLRAPNQHTEQINFISSPTVGMAKRPGTEYVATLGTGIEGAYLHPIEKDRFENYVVLIFDGDLKVFDIDGVEQTVLFNGNKNYLNTTGDAELSFLAVDLNDTTLILNKEKVTATEPAPTVTGEYQGNLLWVRSGNYETTYTVELNSPTLGTETATFTTTATVESEIQTAFITLKLKDEINNTTNFTALKNMNVAIVEATDGEPFTMTVTTNNDQAQAVAINGTVETSETLPTLAPYNYIVEVTPEAGSTAGAYFLQWKSVYTTTTPASGKWEEIRKPGIVKALDATTMPHSLKRLPNGTFVYYETEWEEWDNGDEDSNPMPGFVGDALTSIFAWSGRLGLLSTRNVSLSRPNDFFNFSRFTSTGATSADPIDVESGGVESSDLRHALTFGDEVILFSDYTQYLMSSTSAEGLSASTVAINPFASYQLDLLAPPVLAGNEIFVALPKGTHAGLLRLSLKREGLSQTLSLVPSDTTEHVPFYIPRGIFGLSASSTYGTSMVLSGLDRSKMWVYRWYEEGGDLIQSSWSTVQLPADGEFQSAKFIRSQVFLLIKRDGNLYLETLHVDEGYVNLPLFYPVTLDSKLLDSSEWLWGYDSGLEATAYDLPYEANILGVGRDIVAVATGAGSLPGGTIIPRQATAGNRVYFKGDLSSEPIFIGIQYEAKMEMSALVLREPSKGGAGVNALTSGRLQLRNLQINYDRTGYFRVRVSPKGKDSYEYTMTGIQLNNLASVLGTYNLRTGTFRVPIMANNLEVTIEIINDSPIPSQLLNIEWEAFYSARAQRYG